MQILQEDFRDLLRAVETFQALPDAERSEYFDTNIAPNASRFGDAVLAEEGADHETAANWLRLQAATFYLSLEGIPEVTEMLRQRNSLAISEALEKLSLSERQRIEKLFAEWDGTDTSTALESVRPEEFLFRWPRLFKPLTPDTSKRPPPGVLADFVGTDVLRSSRGNPIIHGALTLYSAAGDLLDHFEANTGGGASSYQITNGPLPPGTYLVSNHRPNRETIGMELDGVGYSFDVDPTDGTEVFHRSAFRIHPDGGSIGTHGCIGVRESAKRLRECESLLVKLLAEPGAFKMTVRY